MTIDHTARAATDGIGSPFFTPTLAGTTSASGTPIVRPGRVAAAADAEHEEPAAPDLAAAIEATRANLTAIDIGSFERAVAKQAEARGAIEAVMTRAEERLRGMGQRIAVAEAAERQPGHGDQLHALAVLMGEVADAPETADDLRREQRQLQLAVQGARIRLNEISGPGRAREDARVAIAEAFAPMQAWLASTMTDARHELAAVFAVAAALGRFTRQRVPEDLEQAAAQFRRVLGQTIEVPEEIAGVGDGFDALLAVAGVGMPTTVPTPQPETPVLLNPAVMAALAQRNASPGGAS